MIKEKDLLDIINRLQAINQEWKTVDAKREFILRENGDKAEFVKDVVAMANNWEPSYLIIGLIDGNFSSVGNLTYHYEKNDLNQVLSDKVDPPIVVDYQEFEINGNEYAVIEIDGKNPPYIVARDLIHHRKDRKRVRIHRGTIYVRHEDRTEGISRPELEKLFQSELRRVFESETEKAQQIALNKPDYWEFLLTAELLHTKMAEIRRGFDELDRGLVYKRATKMNGADFFDWISAKCTDLSSLYILVSIAITEELTRAWGKQGEPGDPLEIKRTIDKVFDACNELLEWESDLRSVIPPDSFVTLKQTIAGWTSQAIEQMEVYPKRILEILERPDLEEGEHYVIEIEFKSPSNLNEAMAEIERFSNNPELWIDDYT